MGAARGPRRRGPGDTLPAPAAALVDDMLACYIAWGDDAAAVRDAYRQWSHAPHGEEGFRFSAYLAALEQEEVTANSYQEVVESVQLWVKGGQAAASVGRSPSR